MTRVFHKLPFDQLSPRFALQLNRHDYELRLGDPYPAQVTASQQQRIAIHMAQQTPHSQQQREKLYGTK